MRTVQIQPRKMNIIRIENVWWICNTESANILFVVFKCVNERTIQSYLSFEGSTWPISIRFMWISPKSPVVINRTRQAALPLNTAFHGLNQWSLPYDEDSSLLPTPLQSNQGSQVRRNWEFLRKKWLCTLRIEAWIRVFRSTMFYRWIVVFDWICTHKKVESIWSKGPTRSQNFFRERIQKNAVKKAGENSEEDRNLVKISTYDVSSIGITQELS